MEIINFNKLDKSMYEGYYWYSNAENLSKKFRHVLMILKIYLKMNYLL